MSPVISGGGGGPVTQATIPWVVDGSGVVQPVSATALPLPAGAAKDATLTDGSQRVGGTVAVDGSGVTQPVSVESLPLPAGAALDATLTDGTQRGSFDRTWLLDAQLDSVDVGSPTVNQGTAPWKVDGSAVVQPVSGAFFQATQPISAAALPLPSGAATEATEQAILTALNDLAFAAFLQAERTMFT